MLLVDQTVGDTKSSSGQRECMGEMKQSLDTRFLPWKDQRIVQEKDARTRESGLAEWLALHSMTAMGRKRREIAYRTCSSKIDGNGWKRFVYIHKISFEFKLKKRAMHIVSGY